MDQNLKESKKRNSTQKEFFVVRWFQPKDDIEKIEKQRAKEVQKRMAANRKQAEKNNKEMGLSRTVKTKEVKRPLPNRNDMPHGGGGVYKPGSATSSVSPNNIQHGGGGSYSASSSKSSIKASDFQQGGGGSYQAGKAKGSKASDYQQGGGGSLPKKSKRK